MVYPLKAIFFDIDDTLYSTSGFAKTARLNLVQAMIDVGLRMSLEEAYNELLETIQEFGSNFDKHIDKMLLRIPREKFQGINPAIIIASGVVAYHQTKEHGLKPYEDVVEVVKILHKTTLIKGVITDGLEIKQAEKLIRLGLLPFFHKRAIFITDQIGIGKSNPKLYQRACEALGLEPHHCLHVGDNPLKDIDPAVEAGLKTCLSIRRSKYASIEGRHHPDYKINNFWELLSILRHDFDIDV